MQTPIVAPHSAAPTIDHESSQLAAPTPIRIGIVSLLYATKKLFMLVLALRFIKIPTKSIPAKYRSIKNVSIPDHIVEKSVMSNSFP